MTQLTWKVGGAQGEGIDSTGEVFATTLNRLGHYVFSYRHFMSLIKGGHTNYKIRVTPEPIGYHGDGLDMLIAFDQRTIDENEGELHPGGVLLYDSSRLKEPRITRGDEIRLCPVPITEMAAGIASPIMRNMVACGVTAAMTGLPQEVFDPLIEERFGKKGAKVAADNRRAVMEGYVYARDRFGILKALPQPRPEADGKGHLFLSGNEAVALGALAAGCRFLAAYPITPATEIMYGALAHFPRFGGKVVQAEDEIAACLMAIGANYSGTRAMTSTSGPGFSLMQEALGLSGITETPLVVVNVMRGGPGTGLPTKTEQSDLNEMLHGSHGEIPRIVLTPTTPAECFRLTVEAFNLAETYQCPVILATDLFLGMSKQSVPVPDIRWDGSEVERGSLVGDSELAALAPGSYRRYAPTASGISPRTLPGQKNGRFTAMSNEHDDGAMEEIEDAPTRVRQMAKRMRKLDGWDADAVGTVYEGPEEATDVTLVGFGSTRAPIAEAADILRKRGLRTGHLQLRAVKPFPDRTVNRLLATAERVVVVENNATGQLADWIQARVGFHDRITRCRRYDGNPMTVGEILGHCEALEGVTDGWRR